MNLKNVSLILLFLIFKIPCLAQVSQFEQKEIRTFLGTQNRGYGPYDFYKFSGATNSITLNEGKQLNILNFYHKTGHSCTVALEVKYGTSSEKFRIFSVNITNNSTFPSTYPPQAPSTYPPQALSTYPPQALSTYPP